MTSMTQIYPGPTAAVISQTDRPGNVGGVDTHGDTHHAAVIDCVGRHLADEQFPTTPAGYAALTSFLGSLGPLRRVGVEGTGAYGAGLSRHLSAAGLAVIEVNRPDRAARRAHGKSDPIDAYAAATAVLSGRAAGTPKAQNGHVEAIRMLRLTRASAVKSRTQAMNQLRAIVLNAPAELREQLRGLSAVRLLERCRALRPSPQARPAARPGRATLSEPEQAAKPRCAPSPGATTPSPQKSAT